MRARRWLLIGAAAVANLVIVGSILQAIEDRTDEPPAPPEAPYYVSLGDSYAQGFQHGGDIDHGYADQVVDRLADRGEHLGLVNFGCGGATVSGMLDTAGCPFPARDAPSYADQPQLVAAEAFLVAHPGEIGLITISIGGNDVGLCANTTDPIGCTSDVMETLGARLTELVERLRTAAGPDVPIFGLTYPNMQLGRWVYPPGATIETLQRLADSYEDLFNPTLRQAYEDGGATFIDVTEATDGYGSLDERVELDPYGEVPRPVARVCELTDYCEFGEIHANTDGYAVMADLIVDALPE